MLSPRQLTGTVALFTGVGCATAVVDEDPGLVGPVDGTPGAAAAGGTMVAGVGGSGTGTTGGTAAGTSASGSPGSGGTSGAVSGAGRSAVGGAGSPGGLGTGGAAAGAGGSAVVGCPDPRMPAQPGAMQGNSGSFETTEAVCYFVEGTFNNWSCSNPGGRSVTINGTRATCGGALPAKVDGGYYFEFGASTDGTNYTSFYWYTS